MDYSKEDCKKWFDRIKRETGIAPTAMAERIGVTPSTINMPLRDNNEKVVSLKTIRAVCDELLNIINEDVTLQECVEQLLNDARILFGVTTGRMYENDAIRTSTDHAKVEKIHFDKQDIEPAEISRQHMADFHSDPRSIPVLGTAAGSALGAFEIGNEAIDFIRRPPSLAGSKEVYAIYVIGESMVPEHRPGDLRIIHPKRPAVPGDSVVIQTYNASTDTREAFIKILVKDKGHEVVCRQHNPPLEITYIRPNGDPEMNSAANTYVIRIHKVLTMNELHGF